MPIKQEVGKFLNASEEKDIEFISMQCYKSDEGIH